MKVMSTPRSVDLDITGNCNLRCTYCSHFDSPGDVKGDLPTGEWLRFFEELGRCAVMRVCLSGGEPFLQHRFAAGLLREAKCAGLHTVVETCGHFRWHEVEPALRDVDLIYFDLKVIDEAKHRSCTGVRNRMMLANARRMASSETPVVFRCPLVQGHTATNENLSDLIRFLRHLDQDLVHLLPYHPFGEGKLARAGSPRARPELLTQLRDARRPARAEAAIALGGLDSAIVRRALLTALLDLDPWVRFCAYRALRRVTGDNDPALTADWIGGKPVDLKAARDRWRQAIR